MSEGPAYIHDCVRCRFLGVTGPTPGYPKANAVDHYVCESVLGGATLIQRGGSDGPNYLARTIEDGRDMPEHWGVTLALFNRHGENSLANSCA